MLALVGPNPTTLLLAIAWLLPPFALAIVDHVVAGAPALGRIDRSRLFIGVAAAAVVIWLSHVLLVPWYIPRTVGVELSWRSLAVAVGISFATHALAFALIYLIAAAALSLASMTRTVLAEYWALATLWVIASAFVLQRVVAAALSFGAAEAWVLSVWLSVVLVAIWSGLAWRRQQHQDAIGLWFGPIAPNIAIAAIGIVSMPLIALALRSAVAQFDWNFLQQKLGVTLVWALATGWATTLLPRVLPGSATLKSRTCDAIAIAGVIAGLAAVPIAARAADAVGDAALEPEFVLDRYAALDASYQLLRSLLRTNAGADAEFYSYLKVHSTLGKVTANPVNVTLVSGFTPNVAPPHVFLFVIDSLRRDYLSPYNPAVTFTPATAHLLATPSCSSARSRDTAPPVCRCRQCGPAACCCTSSTCNRSRQCIRWRSCSIASATAV